MSKRKFKSLAHDKGGQIKGYHADYVPFDSQEFCADIESKQQKLILPGTVMHHQNGVAKRAIRMVVSWKRTIMFHLILHWPSMSNGRLHLTTPSSSGILYQIGEHTGVQMKSLVLLRQVWNLF
jgi:hypothetical protein